MTDSLMYQILSTAEGVDEHEDAGNRVCWSRWAFSEPPAFHLKNEGAEL